MVEIFTSN
jgi:hypothetical protein